MQLTAAAQRQHAAFRTENQRSSNSSGRSAKFLAAALLRGGKRPDTAEKRSHRSGLPHRSPHGAPGTLLSLDLSASHSDQVDRYVLDTQQDANAADNGAALMLVSIERFHRH